MPEPSSLAAFWTVALGYRVTYAGGDPYVVLVPEDGREGWPELLLQRVAEPKSNKNRMHLDLRLDDLDAGMDRLVAAGAAP